MNMIYEINAIKGTLIFICMGAAIYVVGWIVRNVLPKRIRKKLDDFYYNKMMK